jgi:hypothetical protein
MPDIKEYKIGYHRVPFVHNPEQMKIVEAPSKRDALCGLADYLQKRDLPVRFHRDFSDKELRDEVREKVSLGGGFEAAHIKWIREYEADYNKSQTTIR